MLKIEPPTGRDFMDSLKESEDDFGRVCFLVYRCAIRDGAKAFQSVSEVLDLPYATLRQLEEQLVKAMENPVPDPTSGPSAP